MTLGVVGQAEGCGVVGRVRERMMVEIGERGNGFGSWILGCAMIGLLAVACEGG
jgi:hypothetical protein